MSSIFDSKVYARRQRNQFLSPSILAFMDTMSLNTQTKEHGQKLDEENDYPEITLTLSHRPNVSSRKWWLLKWVDQDGDIHCVEGQDLNLLGWRAVQRHEYGSDKKSRGTIKPQCNRCQKCGSPCYSNEIGNSWCSNIYCPY